MIFELGNQKGNVTGWSFLSTYFVTLEKVNKQQNAFSSQVGITSLNTYVISVVPLALCVTVSAAPALTFSSKALDYISNARKRVVSGIQHGHILIRPAYEGFLEDSDWFNVSNSSWEIYMESLLRVTLRGCGQKTANSCKVM